MKNYDVMVLVLGCNMTDNELKDCIQQMMPICLVKSQGFCLTISGYDDDPRGLWAIPEAIRFMKRLVKIGLIAGLEVSTHAEGLVRPEYGLNELPGFGALEVWMCGTGKMENGSNDITAQILEDFFEDLGTANKKSRDICLEPSYDTGTGSKVVGTAQIPDAATRHCPKWNK